MIETQAGGLRQRCSPSLDRWQVVYHLDQATPIALVDVIEMMMGEPTAKLGIVATADRLLGLGRGHSVLAANQKRGSDCHPIVPRRIALVYVSLPTFLSLLDVRLAAFLLAAREPGLSSFFHIACKIALRDIVADLSELKARTLFCRMNPPDTGHAPGFSDRGS